MLLIWAGDVDHLLDHMMQKLRAVVVGGAVLTQEYADSIGADCYAKDAMATVHFADSVFGV